MVCGLGFYTVRGARVRARARVRVCVEPFGNVQFINWVGCVEFVMYGFAG